MAYATRTVFFACLGMATVSTHSHNNEFKNIESTVIMNATHTNSYQASDKMGSVISITWQETSLFAEPFAEAMKSCWPIARPAYVPVEMQFLKTFPEVVGTEPYFKAFEPLLADGVEHVDWAATETVMAGMLEKHFVFDPATFSPAMIETYGKDKVFYVAAHDQLTGQLVGFITFLARSNYPQGIIKVMTFAVAPEAQNRGVGKLLMSSIFNIIPNIKTLFLCTRVTNETALSAYQNWGFVPEAQPIMDHQFNLAHWSFLSYHPATTNTLQSVAAQLKS